MQKTFFPRANAELFTWSRIFMQCLTAEREALFISEEEVQQLQQLFQVYSEAFARANPAGPRTTTDIMKRDKARDAFKQAARTIALRIQHDTRISDELRANLGLTIRKAKRTRVARPSAAPRLRVIDTKGHTVTLMLRDRLTRRKARPEGAAGANVYMCVGEDVPDRNATWSLVAQPGRTRLTIRLPSTLNPGTSVWFVAAWVNRRGERGPASNLARAWVQFGGAPEVDPTARELALVA